MECVVVVHAHRHVGVTVAVVVGALKAAVPGELKLEVALVVSDEDDEPAAVLGPLAAALGEAQRLLVERQRGVEVVHVGVPMDDLGAHGVLPFS